MKPKKHLGFSNLRMLLSSCFNKVSEHRQSGKMRHSIHDTLMSGFACMYFQAPSLLQFQKRLEKKHHKSNLQTLFGVTTIPESTQLRAITDEVDSDSLSLFFKRYLHYLQRGKQLNQYRLLGESYYISMDATEYYSSYKCSCEGCLRTKAKGKKPVEALAGSCDVEEEEIDSGKPVKAGKGTGAIKSIYNSRARTRARLTGHSMRK
jgi:hypothetical protein